MKFITFDYYPPDVKRVRVIKGGPGSGNFGHAGRPGEVGGSAASNYTYVDTVNDLTAVKDGASDVSYFIDPQDRIIDIGYMQHNTFIDIGLETDKSMLTAIGANDDVDDPIKASDQAAMAGTIQMFMRGGTVAVRTADINTKTLRRLQRLMDEHKIDLSPIHTGGRTKGIIWGSAIDYEGPFITAEYLDFMSAKRVVLDDEGYPILKQVKIVIKGGPTSGNYGHAGRPGKVGGSAPGRGGGYQPGVPPEVHPGHEVLRSSLAYGNPVAAQVREDDKAHEFLDRGIKNWGDPEDPAWILADGMTRSTVKMEIVHDIAKRSGVDKEVVNEIIAQWAETSNDNEVASLSLQEAAFEEFGVPLSDWQQSKIDYAMPLWRDRYAQLQADIRDRTNLLIDQRNKLIARGVDNPVTRASLQELRDTAYKLEWQSMWKSHDDPTSIMAITDRDKERKVLRAMYDYTQERLAAFGYKPDDKITLFRGVSKVDIGEEFTVANYVGNAIESWSVGYKSARSFAFSGDIIVMDVFVRNIIGTAKTGFGCLTEGEFVIFGSIPGQKVWVEGL